MKKLILKTIGVLVITIMLSQYGSVIAATQADINANNKKINEAQSELNDVKEEKTETVKQVESLTSQITDYQSQIDELDTQIAELNTKISEAQAKITEKEANYSKQEDLFNARLVATYEAGDTSYLDVILSSSSVTDLISNYYLVTEVATYDTELLEKIQQEKKEIEEAKATLETSKNEVDTAKASKESVTIKLQASKNEKNSYVAKLSEDEKTIQSQIDELQEANVQIDKQIQAAKAKYEKEMEELKKQQSSGSNNSSGNSNGSSGTSNSGVSSYGFIKPVNSYITTKLYYSNGAYHGAVDYGASGINGAPVFAVADGIVYETKALTSSYGNYIIIAHTNGLYTLYAHGQAGSIRVSAGQTVKQGQTIMNVGSTGNSTGPHLHFEVRTSPGNYANRVNPLKYLP